MKVTWVLYFQTAVLRKRLDSYLNIFSQWVEYLLGNRQSFGEVEFSSFINDIFARIVPVEVTDRFLKSRITLVNNKKVRVCAHFVALYLRFTHLKTKKVVHSADNDVDCGCVSCLSSQEVLEIWQKQIFLILTVIFVLLSCYGSLCAHGQYTTML